MRKFNINVNGNSYSVEVEEVSSNELTLATPAPIVQKQVQPQIQVAPIAAPTKAGGNSIKSPLPGLILKLVVASGSKVKKGDKLIVLEAMKMENDIVANSDGVVTFSVAVGSSVATGDTLATIA